MFAHRLLLLRAFALAAFLIFAGRLAYLQLVQGAELRETSEKNHQRWVRSPAPRGLIRDRAGRTLADNVQALTAWLVPGEVPRDRWDALLRRFVAIGVYPDLAQAEAALAEQRRFPGYLPARLGTRLGIETVTRLEEELTLLPGVYLEPEPMRRYPHGRLAAHVIGYLREINPEELAARQEQGYRPGDRIGKAAVERAFEERLRGVEGREEVEVDARGRVLRVLSASRPRAGETIALTLDARIQQAAEQAMEGHRGAAVALDPATGDILALTSSPAYDLNAMSGRRPRALQQWLKATHAEVNRATSGGYPPGSVFKIVTAAAALEQRKVTPTTYFYCDGAYRGIRCWKRAGHGALDLTGAIAQSCNVAFMKMAEHVGASEMKKMAGQFGLGQRPGPGILPEAAGQVPDPAWLWKAHRRHWQLGDTLQVGIGQSYLIVTPMQSARLVAVIANGGLLVHPRLVQSVGSEEFPVEPPTPVEVGSATIRQIARGLRAVAGGEGTARRLDPALHIAGKTGTAQNPGGEDHAWFVGYAPAERPRIAVAVLVEHGGHGGGGAAPVAEAIIRTALQAASDQQ